MNWNDFLAGIADEHGLSGARRKWFLMRFSEENINCEDKQFEIEVLSQLDMQDPVKSFRKQMSSVYQALGKSLPEVADKTARNKADKLRLWLRQRSESTLAACDASVSTAIDISVFRQACYDLLERQKRLNTNALMAKDGIEFKPDDLFVPLGLVERRRRPKRQDIESSDQGSQLYGVTEEEVTQTFQHQDFFEQVIRDGDTPKSHGQRLAITGEPGAGKTTLLQRIGDWLREHDQIPIWISLANVGTKSLREYLLEDWLRNAAGVTDAVSPDWKATLEQLLKAEQVCLLLDGVDEMTIPQALRWIGEQLGEGWAASVRVVLTCRLNVWESAALPGFDVYRNLDFDYPDQVQQFIDQFFQREGADLALGQALKAELEQPGKERIRDSVKNPLRLSLLCYTWELGRGELPDTKAELYRQFVEAFYTLKQREFPISPDEQEILNQALGELAREAIDQNDSHFRLRKSFIQRFLGHPDQENSLFWQARRIGWLNEIGMTTDKPYETAYAFLHPTFQEYFAASSIYEWSYFLPKLHLYSKAPIKTQKYRLFEEKWKETMSIWMGRQNIDKSKKHDFLKELIDFDDFCDGFYWHKSFSLSLELLCQFPDFLKKEEIYNTFLSWALGEYDEDEDVWNVFQDTLKHTAIKMILQGVIPPKYSSEYMTQILWTLQEHSLSTNPLSLNWRQENHPEHIFEEILIVLERLNHESLELVKALEDLLDCQHSCYIQEIIARLLNKIDSGNRKAFSALLNLLRANNYLPYEAYKNDEISIEGYTPKNEDDLVESTYKTPLPKEVLEARRGQDYENIISELATFDSQMNLVVDALIEFTQKSKYLADTFISINKLASLFEDGVVCKKKIQDASEESDHNLKCFLFRYIINKNEYSSSKLLTTLLGLAELYDSVELHAWILNQASMIEFGEQDICSYNALSELLLLILCETESSLLFFRTLLVAKEKRVANDELIEFLVECMSYDLNDFNYDAIPISPKSIREVICSILTPIININSESFSKIERILIVPDESHSSSIRIYVAHLLISIAKDHLLARETLLECANSSDDPYIKSEAAMFLYEHDMMPQEVLIDLVHQKEKYDLDEFDSLLDQTLEYEDLFELSFKSYMNNPEDSKSIYKVQKYIIPEVYPSALCTISRYLDQENISNSVRYDLSSLAWKISEDLGYIEFHDFWNCHEIKNNIICGDFEDQFLTSHEMQDTPNLICSLSPAISCCVLSLTFNFSSQETGNSILKRIRNRLYAQISLDEPSERQIHDIGDFEETLLFLRSQLGCEYLVIILHHTSPQAVLVNICQQISDIVHIGWITDQPIPCNTIRTFHPDSTDLSSAIQSWLDEISP